MPNILVNNDIVLESCESDSNFDVTIKDSNNNVYSPETFVGDVGTYTVKIKDDLKFSDGSAITAKNYLYFPLVFSTPAAAEAAGKDHKKTMYFEGYEAFAKYDVIIGRAAPTTAPEIGKSLADPIKMYLGDIYTVSVNLAGLPGISLPCGYDSKGLPIGLQLLGKHFDEKSIIRAAYAFEQTREYKRPEYAIKGGE